jgi:enoyl-CoA hydratase
MDGIVMGGGIGISAHASHRVVTERSRLAMPETGIGFVPDVGGTFLLGRAPDELGVHAALASFQMGADDAMICGLADHHVPSDRLADLTAALPRCQSADDIEACLRVFQTPAAPGVFRNARSWIAACYAKKSVEAILEALGAREEDVAKQAFAAIAGKSPTSLKITLRALHEARNHSRLEQSLEQEYRLAMACMERRDFREGVRAALVDKDRNPVWSPARLEEVTPKMIDGIFASSAHGGLGLLAF